MEYKEVDGNVVFCQKSFLINQILECGQCFNFVKIDDMNYKIIAQDRVLYVSQVGEEVTLSPCTAWEFENIWYNYFDLGKDYCKIKEILSKDEVLRNAIQYGEGVRILNQDKWECLISFIISQNNRIPMIKNVVRNLSVKFGDKLDKDNYSFPKPFQLNDATEMELRECKTGFRDKYILDATHKVYTGEIDIYKLDECDSDTIRKQLQTIKGVGPKVANCVMLFSYSRGEAFPVDVWIKRAMEQFYFGGQEKSNAYIQQFAEEKFGELSGIAQQYIFNYAISQGL